MYCVDASVIVSAHLPKEVYFAQSRVFLENVAKGKEKIFFPEIVIPEIASGLSRGIRDTSFVLEYIETLREVSSFLTIPIDSNLADLAAWVVVKTGARGADALYIALAYYYELILITLDRDQLLKAKGLIDARMP